MPRNWINSKKPSRTGYNSKSSSNANVKNMINNSQDVLKDKLKSRNEIIDFHNSEAALTTASGLPATSAGVLTTQPNASDATYSQLVLEPIRFEVSTGTVGTRVVTCQGLRYFYKSLALKVGVSMTHPTITSAAPQTLVVDLVKVKGHLSDAIMGSACDLYSYDNDNKGNSRVFKIASRVFHIALNQPPRTISLWKDINSMVKREVDVETLNSEDRATERYFFVFKMPVNTGGLLPVLRIQGLCQARAYEA